MQQEVHPDIFEDVQFPEDVVGETQQADQSWQGSGFGLVDSSRAVVDFPERALLG